MDPSLWCIVITAGILFPPNVAAYPNGSIAAACGDMVPQHGFPIQTSPAPYALNVSKTTYFGGEKITVTLTNTSADSPIEGFFIQAREQNSNTPLGSFSLISDGDMQTLTCTTAASAVSHKSNSAKSTVQVIWVAPASNHSNIQLRATVVRSKSIYWTNVVSQSITYAGVSPVLASLPVVCITVVLGLLLSPLS